MLIKFNKNFNVDRKIKEPYFENFDYNLLEFIENSRSCLKNKKVIYKFSNKTDWETDEIFDQLVYRRQRQGFLIKKIEVTNKAE